MVKVASNQDKMTARRRHDGWINIATGLGVLGQDKTVGGFFIADRLTQEECEELWRGNDVAARIVEVPPSEMLRQGVGVRIGASGEDENRQMEKDLIAKCDELETNEKFKEAMNFERAYGGGAILIGAQDGATDLRLPLNLKTIKKVHYLTVYEPRELYPTKYYNNGLTKKFGEPELYRLQPYTMTGRQSMGALSNAEIHESRFIIFPGIKVSRRQRLENLGWGDSVFVRALRALELFDQTWAGAGVLLADFAQAVFKMKGLTEFIAANDESVIIARAQAMATARSVAKMMIMDSEETFERVATPITGLPDTLDKFSLRLAAAADMPVSLLLGQSPAGLQATGDADIRFFYDRIKAKQEQLLRRRYERLIRIIMLTKGSPTGSKEPANWAVTFPALWQETELEKAQARAEMSKADQVYLEHSVTSPDEVSRSRFGGDSYSLETTLDRGTRDLLRKSTLEPAPEKTPTVGAPAEGTTETGLGPDQTRESIGFTLTPTDIASIVRVNEARAKLGYGPMLLDDGKPDPDGKLTVSEFQAKHKAVIAQATSAASGEAGPPSVAK